MQGSKFPCVFCRQETAVLDLQAVYFSSCSLLIAFVTIRLLKESKRSWLVRQKSTRLFNLNKGSASSYVLYPQELSHC